MKGWIYSDMKRSQQAEKCYKKVAEICKVERLNDVLEQIEKEKELAGRKKKLDSE